MNCEPHKERLGKEVKATRNIAGTPMCENCYKGRPLQEVTSVVAVPNAGGSLEVSAIAAQLGKRGGMETAKKGPEYFEQLQAKRKTFKGKERLSWEREVKLLLRASAILKKENYLDDHAMCKAAYEILISVPCEKLEEKGFM